MKDQIIVGIIQDKPDYMNLSNSIEKAVNLISMAAQQGAELVVFGETWLCGYPAWLDTCPGINYWDHAPLKEVYAEIHRNALIIPGQEFDKLCQQAKQHNMVIVIGANEAVDSGKGNGSIYNSLLIINSDGELAVHHRKLVPTFTEKLLYAPGDGFGLKSISTSFGRIGGLICWEHWMPLSRYAMHESGEHIHVAVWPSVHEKHQLASRQYAFEGRCFVIAVGQIMHVRDIPAALELPGDLINKPDSLLLNGGSCIINPDGSFLMEPRFDSEGLIIQEISGISRLIEEKMTLDVSGHYNRPDIFNLQIDKTRT